MSAIDDLLATIPMDQLAARLGTDENTAQEATRQVLPSLLGQLTDNAASPTGELALAKALHQHFGSGLLDTDTLDLDSVDVGDGKKIVNHIFGADSGQALGLSGQGASTGLIGKLLPLLAPIVMAYLGKKLGGGGFGDIFGQILGGGAQAPQQAPDIPGPNIKPPKQQVHPPTQEGVPNILGDLLGRITGGGTQPQRQDSGGGFLDKLLGGLTGKS